MPTTTQHIPEELIKKALALCGKKITDMYEEISHEDMNEEEGGYDILIEHEFSIEKLAYFLLSPEFIEKYPTYSTVQTIAHDF